MLTMRDILAIPLAATLGCGSVAPVQEKMSEEPVVIMEAIRVACSSIMDDSEKHHRVPSLGNNYESLRAGVATSKTMTITGSNGTTCNITNFSQPESKSKHYKNWGVRVGVNNAKKQFLAEAKIDISLSPETIEVCTMSNEKRLCDAPQSKADFDLIVHAHKQIIIRLSDFLYKIKTKKEKLHRVNGKGEICTR